MCFASYGHHKSSIFIKSFALFANISLFHRVVARWNFHSLFTRSSYSFTIQGIPSIVLRYFGVVGIELQRCSIRSHSHVHLFTTIKIASLEVEKRYVVYNMMPIITERSVKTLSAFSIGLIPDV